MLDVRDEPRQDRYVLLEDGEEVGFLDYRSRDGVLALTHAEVRADRRGEGLGDALVAGALDDVRTRGAKVVPLCGFVAGYLRDHPEEQDLLAS